MSDASVTLNADDVYSYWMRGESVRHIQEIDRHAADPKLGVIYALYRAEQQWSQDPAQRRRIWVYCRQCYCRVETFERWARGARRIEKDEQLR